MRCTPVRYTAKNEVHAMRYTSMRYTSNEVHAMRYTSMRYTSMRYAPVRRHGSGSLIRRSIGLGLCHRLQIWWLPLCIS
jgi:hypothetical protein